MDTEIRISDHFHMSRKSFFFVFFQLLKNVKIILNSQVVQKQAIGMFSLQAIPLEGPKCKES